MAPQKTVKKRSSPTGQKLGGDGLEVDRSKSADKKPNQLVICKWTGCNDISTTVNFCRFHYLANWRKLKSKEAKKKGQELDAYLEVLSTKFPVEFFEKLRQDVEEMSEKEAAGEAEDGERSFDSVDGDDDLDTIIKGIRVEDF